MKVSVSDAKAQLTELVRRAEAGEEVVLTRYDRPVVRLEPVRAPVTADQRRAALDDFDRATEGLDTSGWPCAARSQDFLYDEDGLPA